MSLIYKNDTRSLANQVTMWFSFKKHLSFIKIYSIIFKTFFQ
jgi:hypothetical protein